MSGDGASGIRVLVVEDDPRMLDVLASHIERMGHAVRKARGAVEALQLLEEGPADLVLSDVRMPGMDGRTFLQVAGQRFPELRVVLMTAFGSIDDAVEAMQAGAYSYVLKPFKVELIAAVLRNAAREVALGRERAGLRRAIGGKWSADRIIGTSPQIQAVRRVIREAAALSATVLVTGPSGSGKEMVARAIHYEGPRAARPFVPVNCAAIPEPLFESAMFGHRRGAFTDAHESQAGFAEQSSGGTLFLDEVGDIPLSQQVKLLRMLQESEVTPVGASRPVPVDLRVVAATHEDLEAMVHSGRFREDLYYRVNVLRIHLPGLRERPGDLGALAEHLLLEIAHEHGTPALGFTEGALSALSGHPWPGNVRELRNVVERAALAARGRRIDSTDLPFAAPAPAPACATAPAAIATLSEVEREQIEKVLRLCSWNRSAAARILGIDRRTLFTKIQRHRLAVPGGRDPDGDAEG